MVKMMVRNVVSVCVEAEGVGMTDAGMAVMAHLVRGGRPLPGGCTLVRLPSPPYPVPSMLTLARHGEYNYGRRYSKQHAKNDM